MFHFHSTARVVRNALLATAVAGAGLSGLLGATAGAAHASTDGYVTVFNCGAMSGKIAYSPGLLSNTTQATNATMTGYISNCAGEGGQVAGFGKLTIDLSGTASLGAENFGSGTFTINWPSPLEPSTGTLGVVDVSGTEELSGTVTSGPFTGSVLTEHYVITSSAGKGTTASPVKSQTYINDTSLIVQANEG